MFGECAFMLRKFLSFGAVAAWIFYCLLGTLALGKPYVLTPTDHRVPIGPQHGAFGG